MRTETLFVVSSLGTPPSNLINKTYYLIRFWLLCQVCMFCYFDVSLNVINGLF